METIKYKTALIVGAGEGLSGSLARLFTRGGIHVALAARQTDKLAALCKETGATAYASAFVLPSIRWQRQKVRAPKKMPSCGFRCFRVAAHAAGWWDPRTRCARSSARGRPSSNQTP